MFRRPTYGFQQPNDLPKAAPRDAVKIEFARRLQSFMAEKGWNQSELARQAANHTGDGKFPRDNISGYCRGHSLPRPEHLNALAKAFGRGPGELMPRRGVPTAEDPPLTLGVRDVGGGLAWLRIDQAVKWPVALKIMEILKGDVGD